MFKNVATKIAHNSTLPSIGGNKDLRPLQDLITAEKSVLASLQKLSQDFSKAAEALRAWGMGEGDDLGDTLSGSTTILAHFSEALAQYAIHEQGVREQMKSIRTREEGLDELKRRRKSVAASADSAEKKLNKMSPEHKNLAMQTDTLHRLRDEIRQLDSDIMTEEARLGDFKRSTTRNLMGLKFGGLQELSAKGTIVGDFGKQIIAEIPEDVTQPGLPRNFYNGHGKTEYCIGEVQRYVGEVVFSGNVGQSDPSSARPTDYQPGGITVPTGPINAGETSPSISVSYSGTSRIDGYNGGPMTNVPEASVPEPVPLSPAQMFVASTQNQNQTRTVDDFGVPSSGPLNSRPGGGPVGARFATFPVKSNRAGGNIREDVPPSLGNVNNNRAMSMSFSSQVEQALSSPAKTSFNIGGSTELKPGGNGFDDPVPVYEALPTETYAPPPGPPPGPSASELVNPWTEEPEEDHKDRGLPDVPPGTSAEETIDVHLAYTSSASDLSHRAASDRRVRFGPVSDVEQEMEERRRRSEESNGSGDQVAATSHEGFDEARTPTPMDPAPAPPSTIEVRSRRVPVPAIDDLDDETSLNAAAAREVSREMDSLTFSPPSTDRAPSPLAPPAPPFAQNVATARANVTVDSPPVAPPQPDREATSAGNAGSPLQYSTQTPVPPPHISAPDRSVSSLSTNTGSPYRTPAESPMRTPAESPMRTPAESPMRTPAESPYRQATLGSVPGTTGPMNKSSSPLPATPLPPGTRTISAAAFKRPSPRTMTDSGGSTGPADTSPLGFRKRTLPSSPYPQRPQPSSREPSGSNLRGVTGTAPAPVPSVPSSPVDGAHRRVPSSVPQNTFPDEDDHFDYITAYVNNMGPEADSGSPTQEDYGRLGQTKVINGSPSSPGYAQGRFATNLENSGLR